MIRASMFAIIAAMAFQGSVRIAGAEPATAPDYRIKPRSDMFFGLHFDLHPNPSDPALGADVTEAHVAKVLDRVRPDFVQYDCKGHPGFLGYPSEVGPSAPHIVNDSLAVWRKVTREKGISLYIHFSGLFDMEAIAKHPEWAAVDAAGKPSTQATSVFGPYVEEIMIPQLKEAVTKYQLDGAWVDGECWAAILDYSPAAMAAWQKETGYADAPKSRKEPHWAEWKAFHRRHFEQYVGKWVDAVHAVNPELQLASNWLYSTFTPGPVRANVDFLSGDYDPSMSVDRARIEARFLASTGRTWDLLAWGFLHGHDGFSFNLKPPVHLQQEAGVVLMQGGALHLYYQPARTGHVTDAIIDTAGQVADFCRARRAVSHKSTSVPQVAIVFSTEAILDRSDAVGHTAGHYSELIGAMHGMLEAHYSVDILPEHRLVGHLHEYPLVVLPDFDRFAPELLKALPDYVRQGGRVLAMGPQSARLIEPLLGVKLEGEPQTVSAHLLTSSAGLVNADGAWQKISLDGAEAVGYRFPIRKTTEGGEIASTIHTVGQGRVGAIFGPAAVHFLNQHHPWMREFIGDVARAVLPDPAVKVTGPACIEIALRRTAAGELSVHMLNRANMPTSPKYELVDYIPAAGPLEIKLRLGSKPQNVRLVPSGQAVQWSWSNGLLDAKVPGVQIHEVLVVEPGI